jgi:hypothetical protein
MRANINVLLLMLRKGSVGMKIIKEEKSQRRTATKERRGAGLQVDVDSDFSCQSSL